MVMPEGLEGWVYFIQAANGPIKIGYARDVYRRLSELQIGNPFKLIVLAFFYGSVRDERHLHFRFQEHRLEGEWFRPHPDLLKEIRSYGQRPDSSPELLAFYEQAQEYRSDPAAFMHRAMPDLALEMTPYDLCNCSKRKGRGA